MLEIIVTKDLFLESSLFGEKMTRIIYDRWREIDRMFQLNQGNVMPGGDVVQRVRPAIHYKLL